MSIQIFSDTRSPSSCCGLSHIAIRHHMMMVFATLSYLCVHVLAGSHKVCSSVRLVCAGYDGHSDDNTFRTRHRDLPYDHSKPILEISRRDSPADVIPTGDEEKTVNRSVQYLICCQEIIYLVNAPARDCDGTRPILGQKISQPRPMAVEDGHPREKVGNVCDRPFPLDLNHRLPNNRVLGFSKKQNFSHPKFNKNVTHMKILLVS